MFGYFNVGEVRMLCVKISVTCTLTTLVSAHVGQ